MSKLLKYFNERQLEVMAISANCEYIVASRAFGKSEGLDAPRLLRNIFSMPRGSHGLLSPTYRKLLVNTLPAVCNALDRIGYKRNIHYFVGRKAPKKMGFKNPIIEPFSWDYCIHWFNGSVNVLISFDNSMSANSMSLDSVQGFESKFLDYDKIKNEVQPAIRGKREYFQDCPWHHGESYTTDMPTSTTGSWILNKQQECDEELIDVIKATYAEIQQLRLGKSNKTKITRLEYELSLLRRSAMYYAEFNIFDNLAVIGEQFIQKMKRDLPPLIFRTAILNQRLTKCENGFYSAYNDKIHVYVYNNNSYLTSLDYDFQRAGKDDCRKDGDVDLNKPLLIANDYNAAINTLVCGQTHDRELRTLSSFFVKTPYKIRDVVQKFCDYYAYHNTKEVVYYYDSTAIYETANSNSFSGEVMEVLRSNGWSVRDVYLGQPMRHDQKHFMIDLGLKGDNRYLLPTFNRDNNEYLLLAIESTGVKQGRNGFEKDKSAEKEPDSIETPDETKTHITDAWDTLYIGAVTNPVTDFFTSVISSSFNQQ